MKRCGNCSKMKSLDDFNKKGEGRLQSNCRECNKKYLKEHYKKNHSYYLEKNKRYKEKYRKEAYEYLRQAAKDGCVVCGEDDFRCLHFNHINPAEKKGAICHMVNRQVNLDIIKEETAKCNVMCANCHAKHTAEQFGYYRGVV